jgi:hypothetical protein
MAMGKHPLSRSAERLARRLRLATNAAREGKPARRRLTRFTVDDEQLALAYATAGGKGSR